MLSFQTERGERENAANGFRHDFINYKQDNNHRDHDVAR